MSKIVAFAREELKLDLTPAQDEMIASFEAGGYDQAVWQCGRRGGKSTVADVLALYDATVRSDVLRPLLRPDELRISAIVAPTLAQAQAHISRCKSLLDQSPRLRRKLVAETADSLTFTGASEIRAYACSARGMRGDPWSSCILDELGHFISTEDGNAAGDRILEAATPALAQFGSAGWLIAISTPLWKQGAFWKLVQRATSGKGYLHYRHLSTAEMNPRIATEWLDIRRQEDPDLFSREFLALFIDGVSAYLDSTDVLACRRDDGVLPPMGFKYVAALDPAYSHDNFAMGIAHREDERVVVDGVWTWNRRGHDATLDEVTALARRYGIGQVTTDQHAPEPIREGLAKRGIHADYQPWTNESKANAFAALKVAVNTRSVELPNDGGLFDELCRLEAKPTVGGLTRIAAAGGGKDDRAVVVASIVHRLAPSYGQQIVGFFSGDGGDEVTPAVDYGGRDVW